MKRNCLILTALTLLFFAGVNVFAQEEPVSQKKLIVSQVSSVPQKAPASSSERAEMEIYGTGASETFVLSTQGLIADVQISATNGLTVTPTVVPMGSENVTVTVTNNTTLKKHVGKIIMRSADEREYVTVTTYGTELEAKDLSANPVYTGTDASKTFDNFNPGANGYTVEFKAKIDENTKDFSPFAVNGEGVGFKGYVTSDGMGLYAGDDKKGVSNPSNGGTFYNTDGLYHTYRYAVTGDKRVILYRDGILIDTLRTADHALSKDFTYESGKIEENLLTNGDFEGEYNYSSSRGIVTHIEGWVVTPWDQWNSTQNIVTEERSNEVDQNNHVLTQSRYMWEGGYAAGEVSQIVNVAPNEVYTFSALAKGGIKSNGNQLGSIRIYDLQNSSNSVTIPVTSDSYQTYSTDFETKANTKQIRIACYIERDAWGASISALRTDNAKLTGVKMNPLKTIGFKNGSADLEYFTFDDTGAYAPLECLIETSADSLEIIGTGNSETFTVNAANLIADIDVSVTHGFTVSPAVIKAGDGATTVTVTNTTTKRKNVGKVILRSADKRATVVVTSRGSELEQKDISQNPVYAGGTDNEMKYGDFAPGENGYTIEYKVKTDDAAKSFYPYAVSEEGIGLKSYVTSDGMGIYNATSKHGLSNPSNGGTFYNTDGLYHTYRIAVTPDKRAIFYRDGIMVDTLRTQDFALQPEWSNETGQPKRNLLKNPDFEGEYDFSSSRNIVTYIEGWQVSPWDQYNSTQEIVREERDNKVDQNNHVLTQSRYKWEAGWSAGEVSQIVDVAPNEVYSFSALAKGGIKSNGNQLGSIRLYDMQNSDNSVTIPITSDSYKTYSYDFETKANTKQMRVCFYIERDAWGASISALRTDDVKLTGYSRVVTPQIGFTNDQADIAYFTYDTTGAYAPLAAEIATSVDSLLIEGTDKSQTFTVNSANLIADIDVSVTHGFSVSPSVIKAGEGDVEVTVTNLTTLKKNVGKVILRSADVRQYVVVTSRGSELEQKDLSQNPVYTGNDASKELEGFEPGENGYTVEFKAKIDADTKNFYPYAVSDKGVGFKGYVSSSGMGLYAADDKKGVSNPSNGGTFYNTDGLYHTYRYTVTKDKRVILYRDGIMVDTLRTADHALSKDFKYEPGDVAENLLTNGDFEGEYNYSSSRGIVTHIEGWVVTPWDQWNSTQNIVREERNNEVDQNNHVLTQSRDMWEGGYAAGEVTQFVNVAPNEVYSFSALAKGGIKSNGNQLGSIRIQDMQNSDNKVTIPITSDSYQTYSTDFETKANTKQIRIACYIERDAWGASISALRTDNTKLTGVKMNPLKTIGFINESADLEYFTFDNTGAYAPLTAEIAASADFLEIFGTDASQTFTVNSANLIADIDVSVTHGFSVSPSVIKAGEGDVEVTVTNLTTLKKNVGKVILRSADVRQYVVVTSYGTELELKDLSQNPVYTGNDASKELEGFEPGENGYTVEFKAKIDADNKNVYPYAVSDKGVGFKGYVSSSGMGLYAADDKKGVSNPANGGTFYNTDGLYHTYRYAVTKDDRVIIYRDGTMIDTLRTADHALSKDFKYEAGDVAENLLTNGDFEGEYNYSSSRGIVTHIEGWVVTPWDQWNSTQNIVREERNNEVDQNNHVLTQSRYMWEGGYAAGEVTQFVNVAPNEVYSFSALAKGGIKSNGNQLGSIRIQDMQNSDNKVTIPITSDSYQTYSTDFETKANTKQIRIACYIERDAWGASISALRTDNAKLTGVKMNPLKAIGFINESADLEYFTFDNTGAYAPTITNITASDVSDATDIADVPQSGKLIWRAEGDRIRIQNIPEGAQLLLYDMSGKKLSEVRAASDTGTVQLPGRGVYICIVNDGKDKHVIKVLY